MAQLNQALSSPLLGLNEMGFLADWIWSYFQLYSTLQLVLNYQSDLSHLRIFGFVVYVPISLTQRTKIWFQCCLEIYLGFDSHSIIRCLELLSGNSFKDRFTDWHFDETFFPSLEENKPQNEKQYEITWNISKLSHLDPRTNQCELEVQRIIHYSIFANQLSGAFQDTTRVSDSYIHVANIPSRINAHEGQLVGESVNNQMVQKIKIQHKKVLKKSDGLEEVTPTIQEILVKNHK